MQLQELISNTEVKNVEGPTDIPIAGIAYDSRRVKPGDLFVCIRGFTHDGHEFAGEAKDRGAVVAVVECDVVRGPATIVKVPDTRLFLGLASARFYGYPARKLRLIGVTGTNGKTSTTFLIDSMLKTAGWKTGIVGTITVRMGEETVPVRLTTPEAPDFQDLLSRAVGQKVKYVTAEVSSHSLSLQRVAGCDFDVGVMTNITQDHLDFHGTLENYLHAKSLLFRRLGQVKKNGREPFAVLNADDSSISYLRKATRVGVITYGIESAADVRATNINFTPRGVSYNAQTPVGNIPLTLKLTGIFNVYNSLAALAVGLQEGLTKEQVKQGLESVASVPGRFELIEEGQDFTVVVDYAHTPDGLKNILETAQEFARGRVITVFGCGGDRDKTKRPVMGEIAVHLSDHVIITSDNPRSEDPEAIIRDIEAGVQRAPRGHTYETCVDRKEAIDRALDMARPDDVIVVAGKGHETYQIIGTEKKPFDDRRVVREYLRSNKT